MGPVDADAAASGLWARGSYAIAGDWIASASRACLAGLDLDGARVLDVACGTGTVAIEAARRGADVVGVDLTPSMLSEAACRAERAGLAVDWHLGSFTDLSAYLGFDVVTSAFGAMFAVDATAVADQMLRAVRPGGLVSVTAWSPGGLFAGPAPQVLAVLPYIASGPAHTRWATREGLTGIVDGLDAQIGEVRQETLVVHFSSVEEAVGQMRRWSAPWISLFEVLEARGLSEWGHQVMVDRLAAFSRAEGDGVAIDVSYAVGHLDLPGE